MDRQSIASRIQALLAKTVERGCTEAEALAASAKAQELLYLYQMSRSDVELEQEGFTRWALPGHELKKRKFPIVAIADLCWGIAKFTECRGWTNENGRNGIEYAGLRSDVEFAQWLTESLIDFAKNAYETYECECHLFDEAKPNRNEFIRGLTSRLRQRMNGEVATRTQARSGSGRDLVVTKKPMIAEFLRREGIYLVPGRSRAVAASGSAMAGARFADKAGFGRPVGSATLRIGKGN